MASAPTRYQRLSEPGEPHRILTRRIVKSVLSFAFVVLIWTALLWLMLGRRSGEGVGKGRIKTAPAMNSEQAVDRSLPHDILEAMEKEFKTQEATHSSSPLLQKTEGPIERQQEMLSRQESIVIPAEETYKPSIEREKEREKEEENEGMLEELYDGTFAVLYPRINPPSLYEDLVITTIIDASLSPETIHMIRVFVGGLHQIRAGRHRVPRIEIFTTEPASALPASLMEEVSWWSRVQIRSLQPFLGLPMTSRLNLTMTVDTARGLKLDQVLRWAILDRLVKEYGSAVWIKFGYVIDPMGAEIRQEEQVQAKLLQTERGGSATALLEIYRQGRAKVARLAEFLRRDGQVLAKQDSLVFDSKGKPLDSSHAALYPANQIVIEGYGMERGGMETLQRYLTCAFPKQARSNLAKECPSNLDSSRQQQDSSAIVALASHFGVYPRDASLRLNCHVDLREENLFNLLLVQDEDGSGVSGATPSSPSSGNATSISHPRMIPLKDPKRMPKRVAIALPATSRGSRSGELPVFLRAILPSLLDTVSKAEFETHLFTLYIGYDHGDSVYDNPDVRRKMYQVAMRQIGDKPVNLKFIQLPQLHRVAQLWNLLFLRAISDGNDYFYQVNDDLTLVTPGWLTRFTSKLDSNGGFGVIGPADNFNAFNCSILTQAMVTRVHYEIFGSFYPFELRDWKTDRWLTHVYRPYDTFCFTNIIANNGAAPTRYKYCEFLSWHIYVEAGKRRIAQWKAKRQASLEGTIKEYKDNP